MPAVAVEAAAARGRSDSLTVAQFQELLEQFPTRKSFDRADPGDKAFGIKGSTYSKYLAIWKTLTDQERVGMAGIALSETSRNKYRLKTKKGKVATKQKGKVQAQPKKTAARNKVATLTADNRR